MANAVITFFNDSFKIELNDLTKDRKLAKIKFNSIRSLTLPNNDNEVQIVFSNGELHTLSYQQIDSIDGDTNISSQEILFDKFDAKLFPIL